MSTYPTLTKIVATEYPQPPPYPYGEQQKSLPTDSKLLAFEKLQQEHPKTSRTYSLCLSSAI